MICDLVGDFLVCGTPRLLWVFLLSDLSSPRLLRFSHNCPPQPKPWHRRVVPHWGISYTAGRNTQAPRLPKPSDPSFRLSTMAVPFIDLRRFEPDFLERWQDLCRQNTEATRFVGGPEVTGLEEDLARDTGASFAVGCANGTDALQLALRGLGVGPGDRVLVPDATFWATFEAVVNCGAQPVTVDIDEDDLQMDFEGFRQAIEVHEPKAAILVHLYGWGSARLDEFRALARSAGVLLLEDAAQAYGVHWRGRSIFEGAQVATLSFYPAKVLGACGDAGAALTSDEDLATRMRQLGNHGRTGHYDHGLVGWNSRLGGFEASYLRLSLEYLPQRLDSRRHAAERLRSGLAELGFRTVAPPDGYLENGYLNVTLMDPGERPGLQEHLRQHGIGFGTVYPGAMSRQPAAGAHLAGKVGGEKAARLCESVLNLPLFAHITDAEVDEVLDVLSQWPADRRGGP